MATDGTSQPPETLERLETGNEGTAGANVPSDTSAGPAVATPAEAAPVEASAAATTNSTSSPPPAAAGPAEAAAKAAPAASEPPLSSGPVRTLEGETTNAPRGPVLTVILAVTGLLLARSALFLVARLVLSVKRPTEVRLTPDGGLVLRSRTEMLGRVLRERETLVPREGLVRATREVRFPSLAMYAGLLALVLGSYLGMGLLTDGLRAASPSLLAMGLLIVLVGLGIDFALTSIVPGGAGRCRVLFLLARGAPLCVETRDPKIADRFLAELAQR